MAIPLGVLGLFTVVALIYSMVGFGGGSSYLALMALLGMPHEEMRVIALVCNAIVAGLGLNQFSRAGHLNLKRVLPFCLFSIPMAYWGGRISLNRALYMLILGISLLAVSLVLFFEAKEHVAREVSVKKMWVYGLPMGAFLGHLSGLVGIGGGVFLSPFLLLVGWSSAKEAAAAASFFIVVNSISGLAGRASSLHDPSIGGVLLGPGIAVLIGGLIGARLGARHFSGRVLRKITAAFLFIVSLQLIMQTI